MSDRERGLSAGIEWAIMTPLVLLAILGAVQVGLGAYGRIVATHAAVVTAEYAALDGASIADAEKVGFSIAEGSGLTDLSVRVARGTDMARATVDGLMPTFLDLGITRVSEQATRPLEQVTAP